LNGVSKCPEMRELNLNNTDIWNLEELKYFPILKNLTLDGCRSLLLDADFEPLSLCSNLEQLFLRRTKIKEVKPLLGLGKLTKLDLSECRKLGPVGLLSECPALLELDIDDDLDMILKFLLYSKTLRKISAKGTTVLDLNEIRKMNFSNFPLKEIIREAGIVYTNKNGKLIGKIRTNN
jgi:Leucine-rich repeat (LRR) protein